MDDNGQVNVFGAYALIFNGYIEQKTFLTADALTCQAQVYVANSINNGSIPFRCARSMAWDCACQLTGMVY